MIANSSVRPHLIPLVFFPMPVSYANLPQNVSFSTNNASSAVDVTFYPRRFSSCIVFFVSPVSAFFPIPSPNYEQTMSKTRQNDY